MVWLFPVRSVMLLRREEEEGCVGNSIDNSIDDDAIDVLRSLDQLERFGNEDEFKSSRRDGGVHRGPKR